MRGADAPSCLLERLAVVGRAVHGSVQVEAADVGAQDGDSEEARSLRPLQAAARTYRVAFGPRAGQKVLTLQGAMPRETDGRTLLFDQHPPTDEQFHRAGNDLVQHRLQRLIGWRRHFDEFRLAVCAEAVHAVQHQILICGPSQRCRRTASLFMAMPHGSAPA
jgi:hypothetical protein